jgi:hypothetical protein
MKEKNKKIKLDNFLMLRSFDLLQKHAVLFHSSRVNVLLLSFVSLFFIEWDSIMP